MVRSVQVVDRGLGGIGGDRSKTALWYHVGVEKVRKNWQVRHVGNEGGRDRGALWKTGHVGGGPGQSWKRVGTRSGVGGFGGKRRDRKGVARLQCGGLEGSRAAAKLMKRLLLLPIGGGCQSRVYR